MARDIASGIRHLHILNEHHQNQSITSVAIRLIFLRIGELDTKAEKFQAHVAIESRWFSQSNDDLLGSLSVNDRIKFDQGETIKFAKDYSENYWHPQLFLLNVDYDRREEIKYSLREVDEKIQIREFRDIDGCFHTKFDLHHFPTDIQELNVSIGSALFDREVILEADRERASGINRESFVDQQEWKLYDHIQTKTRFIQGFLFQNDDDNELDLPGHEHRRSILTILCHAARRSNYFFWNGYCLIFLITIVAFSSFAIPAKSKNSSSSGIQFRLAISCTLLLTSIAFRWTMSNSLPSISYLTILDLYAILSIFVLIILCTWHSIIGTIIFQNNEYTSLTPQSYWTWVDRNVFISLGSLYIFIHVIMSTWHYYVPFGKRRQMHALDRRYRSILKENLAGAQLH